MVRLATQIAAASPLQQRFRTGMIVGMFSLTIFSMVVAGVLLTATHRAYSDPEALLGGFDVRAEVSRLESAPKLPEALTAASAIRPEDISAIGRVATRPGQIVEPGSGVSRWRPQSLHELDAGFAAGLRSQLASRAPEFGSDAQVWEAVLAGPGLAVIGGPIVVPDPAITSTPALPFIGLLTDQTRFQPRRIWLRDERGGASVSATVVGVLDPRLSLPAGIYSSASTYARADAPPPQRVVHYFKAAPAADPRSVALGLNVSFGDQGLRATATGEEIRQIQSVRELLNQLLQGFFAIGLLAGLAALGVISMRAVVERRQQIGVLRALGFRRGLVRLSLLLETTLIALLGIGLGIALGLALARRLVDYLGRQYPEITFGVPWLQIGLIALGAYVAALAMAAVPLWRIGRVEPAAALRCE